MQHALATTDVFHDARFIDAMDSGFPVVTLGYLERSGLAVAVISRDAGLLYMCVAFADVIGTDRAEETIGQQWWRLWPEERRPALRVAVTRAGLGEIVVLPLGLAGKLTLTPVRDAAGRVIRILVEHRSGDLPG